MTNNNNTISVADEANYRHCQCGAETVPLVIDGKLHGRECPKCGRGCTCVFSREAVERYCGFRLPLVGAAA